VGARVALAAWSLASGDRDVHVSGVALVYACRIISVLGKLMF